MLVFVLFVLGLVSVSHSVSVACKELVQPLDPSYLEGKWALIGGSISYLPYLEIFRRRDSAYIHFSSNRGGANISYTRSLKVDNKCQYSTSNISLNGSSFTFDGTPASNLTADFVQTSCQDCLIMRLIVNLGQRTHFYLFSRRRQLGQDEMQEFMEQVQCLHMPSAAIMDPSRALCPEHRTKCKARSNFN